MLNTRVCLFVNSDQVITQGNDWKGARSVAFFSRLVFPIGCEMPQTNVRDNGSVYVFHPARFTPKDIFPERTCFLIDYLGYLESQACAHINNPRTYIRIHSIHF